ncbi:MAG: Anthracycline biosynthesis protein DnrV [Nocardia sp.]|uniref:VOC family protein n=1 Tax=Nocardia sp. TaxID=1821 RepID=UPI002633F434|nr:VOC family protein [Nocardia sp.]MCU1641248.1 Anthracycline biosynthesis protein DnrV [Nocardia sp.]
MPSDFTPGAPRWFDVTAPDIPATADFYCALFGWTARDTGAEAGHYTLLLQDGAHVAGVVSAATPDGGTKPAIWLPYFTVADAKATTATAVEAGAGVFIEPTDVFGQLEFAILTDPDGAPYGISHPITRPGTERWGEENNPVWVEYTAARAPAEAMAHYATVLGWNYGNAGWETATVNPYQALSPGSGGREFGGAHIAASGEPAPFWSTTIRVADADAIAARAVELGGSIVQEPQDMPGPSKVGAIADPAGATLGLMAFG